MLHILPNVARSKVNQTMKFRVNRIFFMRNIFVEKSYAEGAEGSPRPFYKRSKSRISLDQQFELL